MIDLIAVTHIKVIERCFKPRACTQLFKETLPKEKQKPYKPRLLGNMGIFELELANNAAAI